MSTPQTSGWSPVREGPPYLWSTDMRLSRPVPVVLTEAPTNNIAPSVSDGLAVSMAAFIAAASQQPHDLVPGVIPDRGLVVVGGEPRTFKTFLAVQLLLSVATGTEFLGRTPSRSGSVLYVSEEGAHGKVAERFERASKSFPVTDEVSILHRVGTTLEDSAAWGRVRDTLDTMDRPALVVLDTLSALSTGEENSARDMNVALRGPKALIAEHGVAVVLLHHTSKNGDGRNGKRLRGSSALWGALDSLMFITRDSGTALTLRLDIEPKDGEHAALRLEWSPETYLLSIGGRPTSSTIRVQEEAERLGGWVARQQIQDALGLSKTQTSSLVSAAVSEGLLRDNGKGGPAIRYQSTRQGVGTVDWPDEAPNDWEGSPFD